MVRYAKSFPACEIEHSEDLKLQNIAEHTINLHMAEVRRSNIPGPLSFNKIIEAAAIDIILLCPTHLSHKTHIMMIRLRRRLWIIMLATELYDNP